MVEIKLKNCIVSREMHIGGALKYFGEFFIEGSFE
jgi:hypothetical protein